MKNNFSNEIMKKIKKDKIKMKSKWIFIVGSLIFSLGLFFLVIVLAFVTNVIIFRLAHEPVMEFCQEKHFFSLFFWRRFPIREFLSALVLLAGGFLMIRKFDFSYKKNIILVFLSILSFIFGFIFLLNKMKMAENFGKRHFEIMHGRKYQMNNKKLPDLNKKSFKFP
jgi:flagellar biogenesis protein FliO